MAAYNEAASRGFNRTDDYIYPKSLLTKFHSTSTVLFCSIAQSDSYSSTKLLNN